MSRLKTTCIIDTYNHERFVCDAIESALTQTLPFDEILVVDDASTDQSRSILQERYGDHERIELIFRSSNGGQLACIQSGVLAASGDICCFLDGDDRLHSNYLERLLPHYQDHRQCTCAFVSCEEFDYLIRRPFSRPGNQIAGFSVGITLLGNTFIGAPTSCLSFRREILKKIFPYPLVSDWVIRDDDYLIGVTSLLGARKYYVDEKLVSFRWHDQNNSWTCKEKLASYRRRLSLNRLRCFYESSLGMDAESLYDDLHREFETWGNPSWKLLSWYARTILQSRQNLIRKMSQIASLIKHKIRTRLHPKESEVGSEHYCTLLYHDDE